MTMMTDAARARSYRSTASAATRRAQRQAATAAGLYAHADGVRQRAAWMTRCPSVWQIEAGATPAAMEATADSISRAADTMLASSFNATDSAAYYRQLAASYQAAAVTR